MVATAVMACWNNVGLLKSRKQDWLGALDAYNLALAAASTGTSTGATPSRGAAANIDASIPGSFSGGSGGCAAGGGLWGCGRGGGGGGGAVEFNKAVALEQLSQYANAAKSFATAAYQNPSEASIPRAHGRMLDRQGLLGDGEKVYRQAASRGIWHHWQQRVRQCTVAIILTCILFF